jgi:hypothetical protein
MTVYGPSQGGVFKSQVGFGDFIGTKLPRKREGSPFISSLGVACLILRVFIGI